MSLLPLGLLEGLKLRHRTEPRLVQLAALCLRKGEGGGTEVLLVTSSSGRWIKLRRRSASHRTGRRQ